jgi:transposase
MIAHGMPIYIALERVDLRFGSERLGAWVREHLAMEPRSRAQFVFVGKRATR